MKSYFIEVKKPSGLVTHFGKYFEEMYESLTRLKDSEGFESRQDAENWIPKVSDYCRQMGMQVASINIVKKE